VAIGDLGIEEQVFEAGGLERVFKLKRLPERMNETRVLSFAASSRFGTRVTRASMSASNKKTAIAPGPARSICSGLRTA
jgi:hypothetical protein